MKEKERKKIIAWRKRRLHANEKEERYYLNEKHERSHKRYSEGKDEDN